ncbi:MAG: 4-hydroxy-tetrahydrodipicolinate synthase [Sedimentisphaerales bacterium]|nr:4-hydroxy-tetrahydrodipicolinate synthase [Sedimentisphaerales bacterium]
MFSGSLVALVTPFADGEIDFETLRELVGFHIQSGTDGIVPVGTTGESPTLSHEEHKKVIKTVVDEAAGKVPVIAGTGSNNTREAIELTRYAREVGADASLQILPYYNKPTQEGLYHHFAAIAHAVDIPIILYNIPGRCAVNMEPPTIARLAEIENIVGIKEASGKLDQVSQIALSCSLTILSGDDSLTLPIASVGGKGVVSVVANIVPTDVKAFTDAILEGDFATARQWHNKLFTLASALLSLATNPIPIKAAMAMLKMCSEEMRLPLVNLNEKQKELLAKILDEYGLLK